MDLVERVKNIITTPKTEWPAIDTEPTDMVELYRSYVGPLVLIPVVAGFLGALFIGVGFFSALFGAILQFVLALAGVYVLALIIDALAPTFEGTQNPLAAFKVAAYSQTPIWVAGIFRLVPGLRVIGFLVAIAALLYSVYILYLGLPRLMRVRDDKAAAYVALIVVAGIVLWIIIAFLLFLLLW